MDMFAPIVEQDVSPRNARPSSMSVQVKFNPGNDESGFPGEVPFGHKVHNWTEPGHPHKKSKLIAPTKPVHAALSNGNMLMPDSTIPHVVLAS